MSLRAIFEASGGLSQWLASRQSAVTDVPTVGYVLPRGSQTPLQAAQASLPRPPAIRVDLSKSITVQEMHTRIGQMRTTTDEIVKASDLPGYQPPAPIDVDFSSVRMPLTSRVLSNNSTPAEIAAGRVEAQQAREAQIQLMSEYRAAVTAYQAAYNSVKPL